MLLSFPWISPSRVLPLQYTIVRCPNKTSQIRQENKCDFWYGFILCSYDILMYRWSDWQTDGQEEHTDTAHVTEKTNMTFYELRFFHTTALRSLTMFISHLHEAAGIQQPQTPTLECSITTGHRPRRELLCSHRDNLLCAVPCHCPDCWQSGGSVKEPTATQNPMPKCSVIQLTSSCWTSLSV